MIGLLTPVFMERSASGTFLVFAAACFAGYIWSTYCVPETANVSLEEIDAVFGSSAGQEDVDLKRQVSAPSLGCSLCPQNSMCPRLFRSKSISDCTTSFSGGLLGLTMTALISARYFSIFRIYDFYRVDIPIGRISICNIRRINLAIHVVLSMKHVLLSLNRES